MDVINVLISILLVFLSGLHFYWAIFGIKDIAAVVPTNPEEDKVLSPGKWGSAVVGLILLMFAFIFINKAVQFVEAHWLKYSALAVGILFLVRAIGDFKYVGFTKRIKNSKFAKLDTKYYSPLCLILSILILLGEFFG